MSNTVDPRFAPPQAQVLDVASGEQELAGRGIRLLAAIVDALIAMAVGWTVLQIPALQALMKAQTLATQQSIWTWTPLSFMVGVPVFLAVQAWPLVTRGQTLGKMLCKLRIVRPDGAKPDAWRLLGLRYGIGMLANLNAGVGMIWGLADSLLIFRASRRCLHDSIADTQVIKA